MDEFWRGVTTGVSIVFVGFLCWLYFRCAMDRSEAEYQERVLLAGQRAVQQRAAKKAELRELLAEIEAEASERVCQ